MGVAAHAFGRLDTPLSGSIGLCSCRRPRRRLAGRGRRNTVDHHRADPLLESLGGTVHTDVTITSLDPVRDLSGTAPDIVMLDTAPDAAVRIVGDRMPPRVRRALTRYRYGPAAHKVDFAIEGDVPWTNEDCRRAGTLHLGGTAEEVVAAEAAIARGIMPDRPFVLVGQQYLADPTRSAGSRTRCGPTPMSRTDTQAMPPRRSLNRSTVRARVPDRSLPPIPGPPPQMALYNPNYVGGDISAGANTAQQIALRPRPALNPYWLGVPGRLPLLIRHATGSRRPRNVRRQRGGDGTVPAVSRGWRRADVDAHRLAPAGKLREGAADQGVRVVARECPSASRVRSVISSAVASASRSGSAFSSAISPRTAPRAIARPTSRSATSKRPAAEAASRSRRT